MMVWEWERVWNAWGGLPRSPQVPPSPPGLHGEGNIMRESVTDGVLVLPHMHPAITLHIKYQRGPPPRKTAEKPWKKVPAREQNTKCHVQAQNLRISLVEKFKFLWFFYHPSLVPRPSSQNWVENEPSWLDQFITCDLLRRSALGETVGHQTSRHRP